MIDFILTRSHLLPDSTVTVNKPVTITETNEIIISGTIRVISFPAEVLDFPNRTSFPSVIDLTALALSEFVYFSQPQLWFVKAAVFGDRK